MDRWDLQLTESVVRCFENVEIARGVARDVKGFDAESKCSPVRGTTLACSYCIPFPVKGYATNVDPVTSDPEF